MLYISQPIQFAAARQLLFVNKPVINISCKNKLSSKLLFYNGLNRIKKVTIIRFIKNTSLGAWVPDKGAKR